MTPSEFKMMWKRDLARAGLRQQDIAEKMSERGSHVTPSAVSQWVKQGYPPRGRAEMLAEILGPESLFAKVPMSTWEALWAGGVAAPSDEIPLIDTDDLRKRLGVRDIYAKVLEAPPPPPPLVDANRVSKRLEYPGLSAPYKPLFQRVKEAAPKELASGFRPSSQGRPLRHVPAYQFENLVVEFVSLRDANFLRLSAAAALFKLSVIRALYDPEGYCHHMLLVIENDGRERPSAIQLRNPISAETRTRMICDLRDDAYAVGIGLGLAGDVVQAANYLEGRAFDRVSGASEQPSPEELDEMGFDDEL